MYLWFDRVQLFLYFSVVTGNNPDMSYFFFLLREVRFSSIVKQIQPLAVR